MKLIDVTVESGYLVIHTDEGLRRQSMNWRGVAQLHAKAVRLKGKHIRTTTVGSWDPLIWFATIEEQLGQVASYSQSHPTLGDSNCLHIGEGIPVIPLAANDVTSKSKEIMRMTISDMLSKAESGDVQAQFDLAQMYDKGVGTNRNIVKAMHWYQLAASNGHTAAKRLMNGDPSDDLATSEHLGKPLRQVTKIFGPPGTGKTHTLLKYVQDALTRGVPPDQIGYFSFTNKATEEAKSRMAKAFPQFDIATDFPYFQTLHSLANQSLRTRVALLSEDQARQFDPEVFIERPLMREGDESSRVVRVKHPILDAASTARAIKQPFAEYIKTMPISQRWTLNKWLGLKYHLWENSFSQSAITRFLQYEERFEKFKDSLGVIDYANMLERAVKQSENLPEFELLIVDEAQDLNPIQWDMVKVLISRAKNTFVAGDDDQAICEAFGARASEFIALESNQADVVLDVSWRVPPAVHRSLVPLVNRLNEKFTYRKNKYWTPKQSGPDGSIIFLDNEALLLNTILNRSDPEKERSFLVIFLTNASLKKFSILLKDRDIDHYAANELVGIAKSNLRLQTVWGAKGGEADFAALVRISDMDEKMLNEDPRLEYVAVTRAKEIFYYVGIFRQESPALDTPIEKRVTFDDDDDDIPF